MFKDGKIKPEEVERLNRAYTFTPRRLSLVDRNDAVCEVVARKIIEIDAAGTHDPEQIAKLVVKQFGIPSVSGRNYPQQQWTLREVEVVVGGR